MRRQISLISGLVLMVFVSFHLLNHALAMISLQTAEDGRLIFLAVWRNWPMSLVLALSLVAHIIIALWALYSRRNLRLKRWEAFQLILGLLIPLHLAAHIVGTRVAHEVTGLQDNYFYILNVYWVWTPVNGLLQLAMMIFAWLHGCIGVHYWLRLKPGYRRVRPLLASLSLLLPFAAFAGMNQGGREVLNMMVSNRDRYSSLIESLKLPKSVDAKELLGAVSIFEISFLVVVGGVFIARGLRSLWIQRRGRIRITYPDQRTVSALPGQSVLDASRANNIPHAAVCGGRGRCSTCRVRLGDGQENLPPPGAAELKVLHRVGAAPNVRLACQLYPTKHLSVIPLLPPDTAPKEAFGRPAHLQGQDRNIAILFADLRAFTKFSESKLPYDVVFVLNRYFSLMGDAVTSAGGHLDKFIGDGVMALFGLEGSEEDGCKAALNGAGNMARQLRNLNEQLAEELESPLRIGIGIHFGPAIVGEMGHGQATSLTAIGDSVNTASRLEAMTKEFKAELVVSTAVADRAGLSPAAHRQETVAVRGREEKMDILVIDDASVPFRFGSSRDENGQAPPPTEKGRRDPQQPPSNHSNLTV